MNLYIKLLCFFTISSIFINLNAVDAINCYICAEGGLEEFGECKTSFPFNCDGYARRFAQNEKIFCRTTRHKTVNATYTVVKECIAESAHYATFPRKSQQLDEECDMLELNGFEVAYCLCRDANLCNGAPIVDQFTEFENKYPELFDPIPASNEATGGGESDDGDVDSVGNSAEQQTRNPILKNTNPYRNSGGTQPERLGEFTQQASKTNRRHQEQQLWAINQPSGTESQNPFVAPTPLSAPLEESEERDSHRTDSSSAFVTPDDAESLPEENYSDLPSSSTFTSPIVTSSRTPSSSTNGGELALQRPLDRGENIQQKTHHSVSTSVVGTGAQLGLLPELQCMQCNEPTSASGDCSTQIVVSCPDQSRQIAGIGRPLCVTRQKSEKHGFIVEKQCTTERAILNEIGGKEAADLLNGAIRDESACMETGNGATKICICSSAHCNQPTLAEQIAYGQKLSQFGPNVEIGLPTSNLQLSTAKIPNTSKLPPAIEVNSSSAIGTEALNCAVCLDVELKDAKADCSNSRTQNCASLLRNDKAYCLTRQTQNGRDAFIVEKSCVTKHQFYQQFPEELEKHSDREVPVGCASTYDGFVNYCICDTQICNRHSIAEQAKLSKAPQQSKEKTTQPPTTISEFDKSVQHQHEQQQFNAKLPPANPFSTSTTAHQNTAQTAAAGGGWEDDDELLAGTARATKKQPAPANLIPITPTTSTRPPPTTTITTTQKSTTTTNSNAVRERLEKWKENMSGQTEASPKKLADPEPKRHRDIFEEFDQENGAGKSKFALSLWTIGAIWILMNLL